ncbi:MAG: CBS domain-containing protein [gamma proteobacterium symbiont of Taylorina sp.]|nr:CBS domain-containing protein [gamma proteobacterium symbiont of Taylorina sp.]
MQVKDIMSTEVETCLTGTSVKEVATVMCLNKLNGLPVVDNDKNVIGVISEKDILFAMFPDMHDVMASGGKADFEDMEKDYTGILTKTVDDLMTKTVASVSSEMPILRAASMMWVYKIRRIPVIEHNKLVGIISMGDVHKAVFQESLLNKS